MNSSADDNRGATTRRRILSATAALIAERGWSGFSTREIAARAGVTQPVVSYHWRSKDELVREAALTAATDSLAPVFDALQAAPSAHAALADALGLIDAIRHEPALSALLFETMLHSGRDERLRAALVTLLRDFREHLAAALARDGVANPQTVAVALSAALDGLL